MTAADMAQTKLCHMVLSGKKYEICYFQELETQTSQPFWINEISHLKTEEHSSNRRSKGNRDTRSCCS